MIIVSAIRCIEMIYIPMTFYIRHSICSFLPQQETFGLSLSYRFFMMGLFCQNIFNGKVVIAIL